VKAKERGYTAFDYGMTVWRIAWWWSKQYAIAVEKLKRWWYG
jgi:hypothetical protein